MVVSPRDLTDIVKAYDVRGLVPSQFDSDVARALGTAFAEIIARPEGAYAVVIGHDMRASSPELSGAFAEGARSVGVDTIEIGLASTDGLYFASGILNLPGAMFTASHNPAAYNGIKLTRAGARPVGQDTGLTAIRERAAALLADPSAATPADQPGSGDRRDVLADYGTFLRGLVDLRGIRPLKVVVDAANGMAGMTVPAVLGTAAGLEPLRQAFRNLLQRGASTSFPSTSNSTAPSPITRRIRSTRPISSTSSARWSSTAPTSAWPSTATPTAASSWTSAGSR